MTSTPNDPLGTPVTSPRLLSAVGDVSPTPRRFGLVLGAGGVLGAAWTIGALAAFERATGLDAREAQVLVGTSAGSVLAAALGCGVPVSDLLAHQRGLPVEGMDLEFDADADAGGALPPRPRLRLGSPRLLLAAARAPRRVTPLAAASALLPRGRGSLAPVATLVSGLQAAAVPSGDDGWAPHPQTWIVAMDYTSGRRVAFGRPGAPAARLAEAVTASCSIPGWYSAVTIGGRPYVDGGTCSTTSLDLLAPLGLDEAYVLAPMVSFAFDAPTNRWAKMERRFRRVVTRRLVREAAKVRATGTRVSLLGPGPEDLRAIGANLMDARRRESVLATSLVTSSRAFAADAATLAHTG